ncbi:MAG: sugar ABC transporter substrate-binding protein [Bacteroidetes bacterium]|nr:sugar ABC transporter substrate-binding protein [Bacteroidota bacterium]
MFKSLSFLMLAFLLISCSASTGTKKVVRFWAMGFEGEEVGPLVREFERLNPDIHVDLQIIPWTSAHDKLLTAFAGNALPDMCQLGNTWLPELHAVNALEPLDSLIASSSVVNPDGYFSGIWETNRIGKQAYGIPWYVDTRVLFYRKDMLNAVGMHHPPENWHQLLDAAKLLTNYSTKLNGRKCYGIYLPVNPSFEFDEIFFAWQNDGTILRDDDCYSNVTSANDSAAFDYYLKFFKLGYSPTESNATTNLYQAFASGFICMFISGPWNIDQLRDRVPYLNGKWAVAPLPMNKNRAANAGGSSLVIFRDSKVKKEAWKLVEFLSRPDIQLQFYKTTYDLPAVKSTWKDSTLLGNPMVAAFYEQLEAARPFPRIPEWEQVTGKMGEWLETVVWGRNTLPQALKGMDTDINRILEKRRWLRRTGKMFD